MAIISKFPVRFLHVSLGTTVENLIDLGVTDDEIKQSDIILITPQSAGIYYTVADPDSISTLGVPDFPTTTAGHYIASKSTATIVSKVLIRNLMLIAEAGTTNVSITLLKL